jgi:hypothetical protein
MTSPQPSVHTRYAKRDSLFTKTPREWRVEDDALVERAPDGTERRLAWKAAARVQISFSPTRVKPWRYVFRLWPDAGERIEIDNVDFKGFANFADTSAAFTPFVHAALVRVAAARPDARVLLGTAALAYAAGVLFGGGSLILLAFVIFALPVGAGWPPTAIIKLVIIAFMLPTFFKWVRRSRPRSLTISEVPDLALTAINPKSKEKK